MSNTNGFSTGALFGFIRTVSKIVETMKPDYMACIFDGPNNKASRKALYEHYKAHRTKMPDDLFPQIEKAFEFCELKGIPCYMIEGVEADDTIGSISTWAELQDLDVFIGSSDKDLCQLVTDHVKLVHLHKDNLIVDKEKVEEIYGVKPTQIIDLLALMGDTSDNIPGLEGVGPKTACSWIQKYGSISGLYDHVQDLPEKKQTQIKDNWKTVELSYELAKINTHVPFEKDLKQFEIRQENTEGLKDLYQEMQFYTLLKSVKKEADHKFEYKIIQTLEELKNLVELQKKAKIHVIDLETNSLNPLDASIVGLSLCDENKNIFYIPFNANLDSKVILEHLKQLEKLHWTGHNIKFDYRVLKHAGIEIGIDFDTMIASYLISPNQSKHNLDVLALEHFDIKKIAYQDLAGTGSKQITLDFVDIEKVAKYCSEDAFVTFKLRELFEAKLKNLDLDHVFYQIEMPLVPVLARMEDKGIYVDTHYLKSLGEKFEKKIKACEQIIYKEAGQEFNISSPKQLGHILFDVLGVKPLKKTKTGHSTSADVLEALQDEVPFVKQVLEYRSYEKLNSTYVESLINQVNFKTKRVHCTFNQSVAATGRLSSQDPNLQNIPVKTEEGRAIREAFKPQKENYSFVSLDYSQIELRLLAHMSEDPILIEAFLNNQDIHARTASEVFGVPLNEVTKQMRQKAKAVNFGILYGQQAFGLSQGLNVSFSEAKEFIEQYFNKYKRVKEYLESQKEFVKEHGFSTTLTGRKRPIPDISAKNPIIRQAAERLAINTPLQGTAADLIKLAMIQIDKIIYKDKDPLGHMLLQIHDELLFEAEDVKIQQLADVAKKEMENVMQLKVPLTVDISFGKNWGEC
jgi:DNA polymerase-1